MLGSGISLPTGFSGIGFVDMDFMFKFSKQIYLQIYKAIIFFFNLFIIFHSFYRLTFVLAALTGGLLNSHDSLGHREFSCQQVAEDRVYGSLIRKHVLWTSLIFCRWCSKSHKNFTLSAFSISKACWLSKTWL